MNKYSPYWILNPLKNDLRIRNHGSWNFYTSKEVIGGESPLAEKGNVFFDIVHRHTSIYDNCLWIFNKSVFNSGEISKLTNVLKSVSGAFCNAHLSGVGIIVKYDNGDETAQPPSFGNCTVDGALSPIVNETLITILELTDTIYNHNLSEYLNRFEYLRAIRNSKTFIKELALWSFVEEHWKSPDLEQNENGMIDRSLKVLRRELYADDWGNPEYLKWKKNLESLNKLLTGKENNITHMRNFLAHGTFYNRRNELLEESNGLFTRVHDTLFSMILSGLEKEIKGKHTTTIPKLH